MRQSPFPYVRAHDRTRQKNDKVRSALADHRDDGTAVRHVMHFLVKPDEAKCTEPEMAQVLRSFGFDVDLSKYDGGVIAEEYREIASEDFDSLTQSLADLAGECGWHYDGFECAVEAALEPVSAKRRWGGFSFKDVFSR